MRKAFGHSCCLLSKRGKAGDIKGRQNSPCSQQCKLRRSRCRNMVKRRIRSYAAQVPRAYKPAALHWKSGICGGAIQILHSQLYSVAQPAASLQKCSHTHVLHSCSPLHETGFAHALSGRAPVKLVWLLLRRAISILTQPVGGHPVGVIEGVPGWQTKLIRGQRRWLGLRSGQLQPIPDAGPWWTLSGMVHSLRKVPLGVWLIIAALAVRAGLKLVQEQRRRRDTVVEQRTLIAAAKSTDLKVQKNRMLRALGSPVDEDSTEVEAGPAAEHQWQDPSEWDPATRQQWDDFMRKSRAFKLRRDQWWEITSGDDTPYHKLAHDKLQAEGKLPDYS